MHVSQPFSFTLPHSTVGGQQPALRLDYSHQLNLHVGDASGQSKKKKKRNSSRATDNLLPSFFLLSLLRQTAQEQRGEAAAAAQLLVSATQAGAAKSIMVLIDHNLSIAEEVLAHKVRRHGQLPDFCSYFCSRPFVFLSCTSSSRQGLQELVRSLGRSQSSDAQLQCALAVQKLASCCPQVRAILREQLGQDLCMDVVRWKQKKATHIQSR